MVVVCSLLLLPLLLGLYAFLQVVCFLLAYMLSVFCFPRGCLFAA